MDIRLYHKGINRVLILNTRGAFPSPKDAALFLSRSITLLGESYLMGPVDDSQRFITVDQDGSPKAPGQPETEAFQVFLRDTGQTGAMSLPPEAERWQSLSLPDTKELLAL